MKYATISCSAGGCSWEGIEFQVEDNGTEIICSGECGGVLRVDNTEHPDYPQITEAKTFEQRLDERLRELGLI